MTKQILVDVTRGVSDLNAITYVTVQDDDKGLIKTIQLESQHFNKQANEVIEIARQYGISKIKVDVHGLGLGVFEYLMEIVGEKNSNRAKGEVYLGYVSHYKPVKEELNVNDVRDKYKLKVVNGDKEITFIISADSELHI